MREQRERAQAAALQDHEPLAETQALLVKTIRTRAAKWLLVAALAGGGGLTAKETGVLDALASKVIGAEAAADPRVPALAAAVDANAKETKSVKRLVRWLVNQEIRRQEREGGRVADPPEDLE